MKYHVVCGYHGIEAALNTPENIIKVFCDNKSENPRLQSIVKRLQDKGITVQPTKPAKLEQLAEDNLHQGIVACINSKNYDEKHLYDWLKTTDKVPLLLILDHIQDPQNLGACIRTALGLGVDYLIIPNNNAAQINTTVNKVSCGASQLLPVVKVSNIARLIDKIKKLGVWVIGTSSKGTVDLPDLDCNRSLAWVMGQEHTGMKRLTKESCDELIKIPQNPALSSLNVSVATGVCLYETFKQRNM